MSGPSMATGGPSGRSFLPHEIPLAGGEFARLVLPVNLTRAEADRLCAVIHSLAFDEEGGTS